MSDGGVRESVGKLSFLDEGVEVRIGLIDDEIFLEPLLVFNPIIS